MSGISIQDYIATSRGRFSFVPGRAGYVVNDHISSTILSWKPLFATSRAHEFLLGDEIFGMSEHQLLDLLILCRNVLEPGGSILFSLSPQGNVAEVEQRLSRTLASLGFATHLLLTSTDAGRVVDHRPPAGAQADEASTLIVRAIKISDEHVGSNGASDPIYVVGDSHIWFLTASSPKEARKDKGFGGLRCDSAAAFFRGFHLGAGLAYNLGKLGTTEGCAEKLEKLLGNPAYIPAGARIMISFGEIDCRSHVCRLADKLGKPIAEIVDAIMAAYEPFLINLIQRGFRPIVWGPVAPTSAKRQSERFPVVGTFEHRLEATRILTARLRDTCTRLGVPLVSMMERLLDEHGVTNMSFYSDPIHLGQRARPLLWEAFQTEVGLQSAWSSAD